MEWERQSRVRSKLRPEVEFVIARMTFGRRIELMRRVRDLALRLEYFEAGREERNQMEASLLAAEIDSVYLQWGLVGIAGLQIDGEPPSCEKFLADGPEELVREALVTIRRECGLDEGERKN